MITPNTKLKEMVEQYPQTLNVLLDMGMNCKDCPSLDIDTVSDACEIHRQDLGVVMSMLNKSVE